MDSNALHTLITAGASFASALLAGFLGTFLGFRRFRKERSYEARLEWYEQLAKTAKVLVNRSRTFKYLTEKDNIDRARELDPVLRELLPLSMHFQELAEQASMYAEKDTYVAISKIVEDLDNLKADFENPPDPDDKTRHHPWDVSMLGIQVVHHFAVRDMRKMMHLPALKEHKTLKKIEAAIQADRAKK